MRAWRPISRRHNGAAARRRWAAILAGALLAGLAPPAGAWSGDLRVDVTGLRSGDGTVHLALYDRAETFPEADGMRQDLIIPVGDLTTGGAVFAGLPPGDYAVAVYHDENGNRKFDRGFLGLPLEGFGFSRGAKPGFGPPVFAEAAFPVGPEGAAIEIEMDYWLSARREDPPAPAGPQWR